MDVQFESLSNVLPAIRDRATALDLSGGWPADDLAELGAIGALARDLSPSSLAAKQSIRWSFTCDMRPSPPHRWQRRLCFRNGIRQWDYWPERRAQN